MSDRKYLYWPGQEKEWMDCELPCGIAICVGTLTGKKPHYCLCRLTEFGDFDHH